MNADKIKIEVTPEELETLCWSLNTSLHCDWDENESNSYKEIVALWRRDFAGYVDDIQRRQGQPGVIEESREGSIAFIAEQADVANLLEKLTTKLPAPEVANA